MNTNNTMITNNTPDLQWEKPVLLKEDWMNTLTGTHAGPEDATTHPDQQS